jgi:Dolichyl-phosphate-mannose-protein mannosyltransferase
VTGAADHDLIDVSANHPGGPPGRYPLADAPTLPTMPALPRLTAAGDQQALAMLMSLARPQPAEVVTARPAPSAVNDAVGRSARSSAAWTGLATGTCWPIALLLGVQALLTLRLVGSNTASSDESLYLWAGRVELAHLLHGSPVPDFATYFSGSPVIYPPLGAMAAGLGGLVGARLLSLAMMLAATTLLHGITRRLFDRRAAFFAAALFVGLSSTQFLGALATYDAMALLLMAAATWLAVVAADRVRPGRQSVLLAVAVAAVLALANATKYASALFDPVVVGVAILTAWRSQGPTAAARTAAAVAGALGALVAIGLLAAGGGYARGVGSTTLARQSGSYSAPYLLMLSGKWLWTVALLAAIGVLVALTARRGLPFALLIGLLAVAVLLAPAEQARIHTETSLFKHIDFGAWFGCAVAGYALAALSRVVPPVKAAAAFRVGVVAVALAVLPGIPVASREHSWPGAGPLMAYMHRIIATHRGPILSDDDGELLHFYLGQQVSGLTVDGTFYIRYLAPGGPRPYTGLAGYAEAIQHGYFSVILLEFVDNLYVDAQIERYISLSPQYKLVKSIPHAAAAGPRDYMIWVRRSRR